MGADLRYLNFMQAKLEVEIANNHLRRNNEGLLSLFGFTKNGAPAVINENLDSYGAHLHYFSIERYGQYFYTLPSYTDEAENDEMVLIKLGFFHDGHELISAQPILDNGWVKLTGEISNLLEGDGALIGFNKHEPQCFFYRNLLSASVLNYFNNQDLFIISDNLRLISKFQAMPELNEEAIAQHFIYRHIYGRETYFKGVSRLQVGELLNWSPTTSSVIIKRDLRALIDAENQKMVTPQSIDWFFAQFKQIVGLYLSGCEMNSAIMLSGGIDLSLVHAAINTHIEHGTKFPSYSFVIDSPGFAYEVEYAVVLVKNIFLNGCVQVIYASLCMILSVQVLWSQEISSKKSKIQIGSPGAC